MVTKSKKKPAKKNTPTKTWFYDVRAKKHVLVPNRNVVSRGMMKNGAYLLEANFKGKTMTRFASREYAMKF